MSDFVRKGGKAPDNPPPPPTGHAMPPPPPMTLTGNFAGTSLCPDLLSIRNIGEADGWCGHVVRGFFRLLKWVTGV